MATTIEEFKQAFANVLLDGLLTRHDQFQEGACRVVTPSDAAPPVETGTSAPVDSAPSPAVMSTAANQAASRSETEFVRFDEDAAAALKSLKQLIESLGAACPEYQRVRCELVLLVQRYRDARDSRCCPGVEAASALDEIRLAAETAISELQNALRVGATGSAAGVEPEPQGDAAGRQYMSQRLRRGARGPAVSFLQEQLNEQGATLQVDGAFGLRTQRAVTDFQRSRGLDADGVVGPPTWQALLGASADGSSVPADSPRPQPPRDRNVQTSMAVANNVDYDAFRYPVVGWIGQFVLRQRADALVDASNLRAQFATLHESLRRLPAEGTTTFQIAARLVAGPARYEAVEFSVQNVNTSDSIERPATEGGDIEEGGVCVDDICVDPAAETPPGDMSVDRTPGPPVSQRAEEPAPVCGGDEVGDNADRALTVEGPPAYAGRRSPVTFNATGELSVDGRTVSQSNFPGQGTGTVAISAGRSGRVRISVALSGTSVELGNVGMSRGMAEFRQSFSVAWDVSCDPFGRLTIGSPAPDVGAQSGRSSLRLDSVNPATGASHVQVSPKVVGPSVAVGENTGVTVGAPGLSGNTGGTESYSAAPSLIQKTFRLNINVCNPSETETQQGKAPGSVEPEPSSPITKAKAPVNAKSSITP